MLTRRDLRGIISDYYKTADLDVENLPRENLPSSASMVS